MKNKNVTMKKLSIGIMGASGMVGRAVISSLKDYSVRVYTSAKDLEQCEIFDRSFDENLSELRRFLKGIDCLVYLSHDTNPVKSIKNFPNNFGSNIEFALKAIQCFKNVSNPRMLVLYVSSGGAVYGNQLPTLDGIYETACCNPLSPYGVEKLSVEHLLKVGSLNGDYRLVILRVSNLYGKLLRADNDQGVIGVILNRILNDEEVYFSLKQNPTRDYIHLSDFCRLIRIIISRSNDKIEGLYNVGTGVGTTILELKVLIQNIIVKRQVVFKEKEFAPTVYQPSWNVLNINKVSEMFDWKPEVNLKSGLEEIIKFIP